MPADSALFEVPLRPTEGFVAGQIDLTGWGAIPTPNGSFASEFSCGRSECYQPGYDGLIAAGLAVDYTIEGWATGRAYAWPDTVACGTTTPLPLTATQPGGAEGYLGPGAVFDFRLPGGESLRGGALLVDGVPTARISVPYEDVRAGGVAFRAPACETMSAPGGATLWVENLPGGMVSHFFAIQPPPATAFRMGFVPDTVSAGEWTGSGVVAVTAEGQQTYLDPATPVTLSVSVADLGVVTNWPPGSSTHTTAATITVPYGDARSGGVRFSAFSSALEHIERDTPVTVTAVGGGLSGSATVVIRGPLRLDLIAAPNALPNGGASILTPVISGGGRADVPASATFTFTLADASLGTLMRRTTRETGATLANVPRFYADQGDVVFMRSCSGPAAPGGVAHITAVVGGWPTLVDTASVSVGARLGGGPAAGSDTLIVSVSPSPIAPGDSAVVSVQALDAGGCDTGGVGGTVSDSTRIAVTVTPTTRGLLSYKGQNVQALRLPYADVRSGKLRYVASSSTQCDSSSVQILVMGGGASGRGSVSIVSAASNRSPTASRSACSGNDCGCTGDIIEAESKQSITDWYVNQCGWSPGLAADSLSYAYERSLASFLFGGLGAGTTSRFNQKPGLDGYQTWTFDENQSRLYDYVNFVFEAKFKDNEPFARDDEVRQARRHLQFLASERDRHKQDYPAMYYWGTPIYVVASQNQGYLPHPDSTRADPWRVGSITPNVNRQQQVLGLADSLGVWTIIGAR